LRSRAVRILSSLADKEYDPALEALIAVVKEGKEHHRHKPVSKAINKLAALDVKDIIPLLEKIVNKRENRYLKKAAKAALNKLTANTE